MLLEKSAAVSKIVKQSSRVSQEFIDGFAQLDVATLCEAAGQLFSRGLAIGACTKTKFGAVNEPLDFGGLSAQPGDIVVGDRDGMVIIDWDLVGRVYEAGLQRRGREQLLREQLQKGKTSLELLGSLKVVREHTAEGTASAWHI